MIWRVLMVTAVIGMVCGALWAGSAAADDPNGDAPIFVKPFPEDAFSRDWFFYGEKDEVWEKLNALVGEKAPELIVGGWREAGREVGPQEGRPMVIDFWATWCPPCRKAIPHSEELADKYVEDVNFIAVCNTRGGEKMDAVAGQLKMRMPTAVDKENKTAEAYGVQWWPFYVLVDSEGIVRAAGLNPEFVGDAVDKLLEIEKERRSEEDE